MIDPPLTGLRIVVTRPKEQADDLVRKLEERGAIVVPAPMIKVEAPTDGQGVLDEIDRLHEYDWLIFTSVNGARSFLPKVRSRGGLPPGLRICAIGVATAAQVALEGGRVDLVPGEYVAESVVEVLRANLQLAGARLLLARAEHGRQIIPDALRASGSHVTDLPVYRTVPDRESAALLKRELAANPADLILFASSSTVRNFHDLVTDDPGNLIVASIGPITSDTIRQLGWTVDIEASVFSADGVLEAIVAHYQQRGA